MATTSVTPRSVTPRDVQLLAWRGALHFEANTGLRFSKRISVYAQVKRQLGFKGTKVQVLCQLEDYIEAKLGPLDKRYTVRITEAG